MKKSEVKVGHMYLAKVSDRVVQVRIDSRHSRGGWNATNTATGKRIHIKSAQRLHGPANTPPKKPSAGTKAKAASTSTQPAAEKATQPPKTAEQLAEKKPAQPKRMSALNAAAEVLKQTGKPMTCKALITSMAEQGLWASPAGKTPAATLYSAILREISKAVDSGGNIISRFRKVDRGTFAFNDASA